MTELVAFMLVFVAVGIGFLMVNLFVGKLVRPNRPNAEKSTIYECGEPTVGSAWIQFDLRFYVVALLFVIFDVEMAFFFPWGVVFGTATHLANEMPDEQRVAVSTELLGQPITNAVTAAEQQSSAQSLAWLAFGDLLVFFGVVLVGFAYLWKRGDLDWVRSTAAQD